MGKIGVKGLLLEYGEYLAEYSPTPSLKPLSRFANPRIWVIWLVGCLYNGMGVQPDDGSWEMFVEENISQWGGEIFGSDPGIVRYIVDIYVALRRRFDVEENIRPRVRIFSALCC